MRSETLFTLGVGGYVAGLSGTLVVLSGVAVPGVSSVALAVGIAVLGFVVGATVAGRRASPDRLAPFQGRIRPVVGVFSPPLVLLFGVVLVEYTAVGPGGVFVPAIAGTALSIVGTLAVVHAAERVHAERLEVESETYARLPGWYTHLRTTYGTALAVVGALLLAVYVWAIAAMGFGLHELLGLICLVTFAAPVLRNREVVVVDDGLKSGTRLRDWEQFEQFEVTDDALVLHQPGWGAKTAFPLSRIDDLDAVTDALDRHLPRANE